MFEKGLKFPTSNSTNEKNTQIDKLGNKFEQFHYED